MKRAASSLVVILFFLALSFSHAQTPDPHSIPVVDGALGPCSADFTINDTNGKPVYAAQITVRVNYGRFHKLDLEVGTNVDGKARFSGLPTSPRSGLFFQASESDRAGNAFDDPSKTCTAQFTVVLRKPPQ